MVMVPISNDTKLNYLNEDSLTNFGATRTCTICKSERAADPVNKPKKKFKLSGGIRVFDKNNPLLVHDVYLKKVIYSNPATIAFWSDGTKTSSKTNTMVDVYSVDAGIAICVLKKLLGSDRVCDILKYWTPDINKLDEICEGNLVDVVDLKDVRKKEKAEGRL